MRDVRHSFDLNGGPLWDVSCVISCWCGGAFDTKRERLVVWGGGHGQYGGNELYAFNMNLLKWERVNDPSPVDQDADCCYPDGTPASPHSYNYLQYLPAIDKFCSFGLAAMYPGIGTTNITFLFDFETKSWSRGNNVPPNVHGYSFSAVDLNTGFAWQHGAYSSSRLAMYNPYTNTWTTRNQQYDDYMGSGFTITAAMDAKRKKMVAAGDGVWMWDVSLAGNVKGVELSTTGDNTLVNAGAIGFDYDPVSERFIGWDGGQSVYSLDLGTNAWQKHSGTGANPGPPNGNHTYGRFRYSPKYNVFVVVNSVDENVFIYRHTAAQSAPQWYLDLIERNLTRAEAGARAGAGITLSASPNPFKSAVAVKTSGASAIYDVNGRLVFRTREHRFVWNAEQLPAGIYLLKSTDGHKTLTHKLILMK
jgi:hypothetical protein